MMCYKGPTPKSITLWIGVSTSKFERSINNKSIVVTFAKYPLIEDKTGNVVYTFFSLHKNRFEDSMKERAYL